MNALKDVLGSVNDWLKFAEAKNAVLATTSGVALWAVVGLIFQHEPCGVLAAYFFQLTAFLGLAIIVALISFLPVLNYSLIIPNPENIANGNLLYFGYLATLSPKKLLDQFQGVINAKEADLNKLHGMYAEQIIINSRLALTKYGLFELGASLVVMGVTTPILGLPLLLFSKSKRSRIDGL